MEVQVAWLIEKIQQIDIGTIVIIGFLLWQMRKETNRRFDKVEERLDRMQQTMHEMDKRIFGLEVSFHSKECCILKENRKEKAE